MNKGYQNFKKRAGQLAIALTLAGTTAIGANAATVTGVTKANVNMRSGAGTKYKVVSVVKADKTVTILGQKGSWYKVKYNGKTGYISKSYVIKKNYTVKKYSGKYKTKVALTVRKGPGTNYVKAGTLKKGTVVTVKGKTSNGWLQISYKGATRYISGSSKYVVKYTAPVKNNAPVIDVEDTYTLTKGEDFEYAMLNATATDKEDGDLTDKIDFSGVVNTGKVGEYTVKLTVKDSKGATATKSVKVVVEDVAPVENNAPVINVTDEYTLFKGHNFDYTDLKATATDPEDGDLTGKIAFSGVVNTGKVGDYTVKLTVTDKGGKTATKTVKVIVKDVDKEHNQAPVINVNSTYTIGLNGTYTNEYLGATATDFEDGDLTRLIDFSGNVDTSKVGTYKVTLTVTDSLGAKTTKTVEVKVVDVNVVPVINVKDTYTIEQGKTFDYALLGATAKDFEDRDLTKSIVFSGDKVSTIYSGKTFTIKLTVKDSKGAEAVKDVTVKVVPDKDPVITANNVSVEQGDVLDKDTLVKLSGLKADDGNGNDITSAVEFIGLDKVKTNVEEGTSYDVYAKVVDNGVTKTKKITITITKNEGPVISNIKFNGKDVKDNKVTIKQYSDFNLNMFKATAEKNGKTYNVTFKGKVDVTTVGKYTVKATATDSKGQAKEETITVIVEKYDGNVEDFKKPVLTVPNKVELNYAESKGWKQSEVLQKITEKINATATEAKDTNKKLDVKYNEDDLRAVKIDHVGDTYKVRVSAESKEYKGEVTTQEVTIIIVNHDK